MRAITSIASLLIGIGVILAGNGLIGTLLGVRGGMEGFSSAVLGLIMAGYFGGFVAGTFIVPPMINRVGHVRSFAALASLCSITVLLHGLFPNEVVWFLARVSNGICIVGVYIVIESWLNQITSNAQRGQIFSVYMTTTLMGLGIGQMLLLAGEISTLQLFVLASALMSLGLVPVALTPVPEPPIIKTHRLGMGKLYRTSPLGVVGALFAGVSTGAFWGLGPVMANAIGLDAGGVSGFMALTILGGIVLLWPIGRLSDRFDRRKVLSWVFLFTGLAAFGALFLVRIDLSLIMLGGLIFGGFGFSMYALSASHTNDHVEPQHMLEAASSMQLLYGAGAIIGPLAAGLLMQSTSPAALLPFMGTAALVPAAFALWRMRVRPSVPADEKGDWVPQFVTSPAVLEMHPEQEDEADDESAAETVPPGPSAPSASRL